MPTSQHLPQIRFVTPVIEVQRGTLTTIPVHLTVYNTGPAIVCLNLSGTSTIYFILNDGHSNSVCRNKTITAAGQSVTIDFQVVLNSSAVGSLWSQMQASVTDSNHRASSNSANLHLI